MTFGWKRISSVVFGLILMLGLLAACGGGGDDKPAGGDTGGGDSGGSSDGDRTVVIGGLDTITGPSSDTGASYAKGREDYFNFLESTGGIDGVSIEFKHQDYRYDMQEAQRTYQQFRDRDGAIGILGWGTGDTEALRQQIVTDEIPFISASYSENLKNIDESPYNFFTAASYSDQGRAILKYILDNHEGNDAPTVALFYPDNGFGHSPIQDMKDYAEEIGVEIVDEQIVDLDATEAQSQLLNMKKKNPDYGIIQETWGAAATILRDAQTAGIETQFFGLNQAVGEGIIEIAGDVSEGYMGALVSAFPYEDFPGIEDYKNFIEESGRDWDELDVYHIQGWVAGQVMAEGIKNAAEATDGEITGADLREGLEAISDMDLGGLQPDLTFTDELHAGTSQIRIGIVKDGKWEAISDDYVSSED